MVCLVLPRHQPPNCLFWTILTESVVNQPVCLDDRRLGGCRKGVFPAGLTSFMYANGNFMYANGVCMHATDDFIPAIGVCIYATDVCIPATDVCIYARGNFMQANAVRNNATGDFMHAIAVRNNAAGDFLSAFAVCRNAADNFTHAIKTANFTSRQCRAGRREWSGAGFSGRARTTSCQCIRDRAAPIP
jgi:hypothetical protein